MESKLDLIEIRPIEKKDNPELAKLIRTVMPEFGASGPGFAIVDAEVESMFDAYTRKGAHYLVALKDNKIIGGAGIAPLEGGDPGTCELKKMYFYPEARGFGLGAHLLNRLLPIAKNLGYGVCYLETLKRMDRANRLYQRFGFSPLESPLGNTGHYGCDCWYERKL